MIPQAFRTNRIILPAAPRHLSGNMNGEKHRTFITTQKCTAFARLSTAPNPIPQVRTHNIIFSPPHATIKKQGCANSLDTMCLRGYRDDFAVLLLAKSTCIPPPLEQNHFRHRDIKPNDARVWTGQNRKNPVGDRCHHRKLNRLIATIE